jgi:hypothetical protein
VAGLGSLPGPANRESGANPERPRRGDRAQEGRYPSIGHCRSGWKFARLVRRPDARARKSEDLPTSTATIALRGTGDVESYPVFLSILRFPKSVEAPASASRCQKRFAVVHCASWVLSEIGLRSLRPTGRRGGPVMQARRVTRCRFRLSLAGAIGLAAACCSGCGGSSQEMQLPDQARKTVERRKVDVQAPPAKPKPGAGGSRIPSGK